MDFLEPSKFIPFVAFVLPGFVAWKVSQLRIPQGEQKPQDVLLELMGYGIVNAVVATLLREPPTRWKVWPTDTWSALVLFAMVILLPTGIAFVVAWALEIGAKYNIFVSAHPTAWDRLVLARLRRKPYAVLLTLQDGTRLGGAFGENAYASNYPYDKDLLIDQVWEVDQDTGEFKAMVDGEAGLYIEKKDILTLEIFDLESVVRNALAEAEVRNA